MNILTAFKYAYNFVRERLPAREQKRWDKGLTTKDLFHFESMDQGKWTQLKWGGNYIDAWTTRASGIKFYLARTDEYITDVKTKNFTIALMTASYHQVAGITYRRYHYGRYIKARNFVRSLYKMPNYNPNDL